MKRTSAIVCLIIILLNAVGFYIFFFLQLSINRQEMRERIKNLPLHQLEKIVLSEEEFETAKVEDYEVRVNGKMYDVARTERKDGNVVIYALGDEKEDDLLALIDNVLREPVEEKHMPAQVLQSILLIFIPAENDFSYARLKEEDPFTRYLSSLENADTLQELPPPKGSSTILMLISPCF